MPRLLLLLDDPDLNCEAVAEVIRVDPGLTADVLHIANAASRGGQQRSDTLTNAVNRVGLREIYRTVMKIVTTPAFNSEDGSPIRDIDLWRHSLAAAVAAQMLARELTDLDPEVAFTAGLLHDIGKVVMAHAAGEDYSHLLSVCAENQIPVVKAEYESFRITHAEAAGRLLRSWHFPDRIVDSVVHHHNPLLTKTHSPLTCVVYLANIVSYRIGQGRGFPTYAADPDPDVLDLLNLDNVLLKGCEEQVIELFRREQERF